LTSFYGYNFFQWNAAIRDHTLRLEPTSAIFLNSDGGANELASLLPGCKVIARIVSDQYEKKLHRNQGEAVRYIQARAPQVNRSVYINIGCEPPVDSLDDMRRLVDEYMAAFEWAQPRGIRVAGPHSAHYGWTTEHWRIFAPLAGYIGRYPDLFLLTGDEYFAGVPFSGVQDTRLPEGNEQGHIRPETWRESDTGVYYHVGRMPHNLFPMLQSMGLSIPLTVMTEAGADDLGDVEAWREGLIHTPPYDKIKGWKTLIKQWDAWGAPYGWDARTYFLKGLEAIRDVIYKPWPQVIGADLFVLGNNGDPLWLGMDHWDADMMAKLETTNVKGQPPVPTLPPVLKPANPGLPIEATMRSAYMLRQGPGTEYADGAITVPTGAAVRYYPATERDDAARRFRWVFVEYGDRSGWVASQDQFASLPDLPDWWPASTKEIGVPFVSQRGVGVRNECGESALASVLQYWAMETGREVSDYSVEKVIAYTNNAGGYLRLMSADASERTMLSAALHFGMKANVAVGMTMQAVVAEIDAGRPVVALVERGKLPGTQAFYAFEGAHYVTIDSYDELGFWISDPLGKDAAEGRLHIAPHEFDAAWANVIGNSGHRQALVIDAEAFAPPPVVPPPLETRRDILVNDLISHYTTLHEREQMQQAILHDINEQREIIHQIVNELKTIDLGASDTPSAAPVELEEAA